MAQWFMCHFCKKRRSVAHTEKHTFITVLASIGDKRCRLDVARVNRDLPIDALDVSNADVKPWTPDLGGLSQVLLTTATSSFCLG